MIGLQVCFHSEMKHENDVSNMVGCLQVVRIYSFKKEIKVNLRASYIVFLFVKNENNFIKQPNMLSKPSQPGQKLDKICANSRAGENPRLLLGFSLICSQILPSVRLGFKQAMKARRTCFIS